MLFSILSILVMVLGFGFLIFIHELGHFLAAKWAGIRTEGFAIGMGPVLLAWRKGVGLTRGSTDRKVVAMTGKPAAELRETELERHGLGETEYSLRLLPIGGFVKMLGQDDSNPNAVSDDTRSYTQCSIGKRMIVVSAGVVFNVITAVVFFVIAFMVGVKFEAPVVGSTLSTMPAGRAVALNAAELGVTTPGLQPGDVFLRIDGDSVETFADVRIASAMAKPEDTLRVIVRRPGVEGDLEFHMQPQLDPTWGLLGLGLMPAQSSTLFDLPGVAEFLDELGLSDLGIEPGMTVIEAGGTPISTLQQLHAAAASSEGAPLRTVWSRLDDGAPTDVRVEADIDVNAVFQVLRYPGRVDETLQNYEEGLVGLVPLVEIATATGGHNEDILFSGDVILRAGSMVAPRMQDFRRIVAEHADDEIDLLVLRDGEEVEVTGEVDGTGRLGIAIVYAWGTPLIARPMTTVMQGADEVATAAAPLELHGRTRLVAVGGTAVADWYEFRRQLRDASLNALAAGAGTEVEITVAHPTPGHEEETLALALTDDDVRVLHDLGWRVALPSGIFDAIYVERTAGGNPWTAIVMGVEETHNAMLMVYLTIDRLVRGSVGIEQLRGPVGIVDLGVKVLPRGLMYFLFFLGMISVNLAVLNFLPLPIVDGGLFLFLVYEKIKGRPPSVAFQNLAFVIGICLIGALFLVTFYNDIMRLIQ